MRVVVKLGGAVAHDSITYPLALLEEGHEVCVVHGAGPQISLEMARRGIEVAFVGGRRVTTPEVMDVVREALLQVNSELVSAIGDAAVGIVAGDVGLEADRVPELGLVGNPLPGALPALIEMLEAGKVPVVAPLARGPLNINADEAAAMIAVGIGADRVHFVTDVPGLLNGDETVASINVDDAERLIASGELAGGIIPKLTAAVHAARLGVVAEIGETAVVT
jgi:acetylglutamate kinase